MLVMMPVAKTISEQSHRAAYPAMPVASRHDLIIAASGIPRSAMRGHATIW
jgi:hypothetical protein